MVPGSELRANDRSSTLSSTDLSVLPVSSSVEPFSDEADCQMCAG